MKTRFIVPALILSFGLFVAACGGGGSTGKDDVKDSNVEDMSDGTGQDLVPDQKQDVPDDLIEDIPDTKSDADQIVPPDVPDIKEDEVELDVCDSCDVDTADAGPKCDMECDGDSACVGKFGAEADICHNERCLWNTPCGTFQCVLFPVQGCCLTDNDCKDNNTCTVQEKCLGNNTCSFVNDDANPACCQNKVLLNLDFETGVMPPITKLEVVDHDASDNVTWSIVDAPCSSKKALYLGDTSCMTYYNGQLKNCSPVEDISCTEATEDELCPPPASKCDVTGADPKMTCVPTPAPKRVWVDLVAPELNLPSNSFVTVTFKLRSDTEPFVDGSPYDFDRLKLLVKVGGIEQEVAYTSKLDSSTGGFCKTIAADLSTYSGDSVELLWRFDTLDGTNNFFEGLYLDDIKVLTYCKTCTANSECNDSDPCTSDSCIPFSNKQNGSGYCQNSKDDPFCHPCDSLADCQFYGPHPEDEFCWPPLCNNDGLCEWAPNPACCNEANLKDYYTQGFEGQNVPEGFFVQNMTGSTVGWNVVDLNSYNSDANDPDGDNWSFYFGNPAAGNYDCGKTQCTGSFTTPYIDLADIDANGYVKFTFFLNMSTEFDEVDAESYPPDNAHTSRIDVLYIEAINTDGSVAGEVWTSDIVFGTTKGLWQEQWADLSGFKGQKIALRFRFDTGDVQPPNNDFGGIFVDEMLISSVCDPVCSSAASCGVATECSLSVCSHGVCETELVPECCTDTINTTCDDGDDCTDDTCDFVNKTCSHEFSNVANCCTPYDGIIDDSFPSLSVTDWKLPAEGPGCGDGLCNGTENCSNCAKDCNQCTVSWRVTDHRSSSTPNALYFGNTANWSYANGSQPAYGKILSPAVQLPPYGIPIVNFKLWLDTEHTQSYNSFIEPNEYDNLNLYVQYSTDNVTWSNTQKVWSSMSWDIKGSTYDPATLGVNWKNVQFGLKGLGLESKYVRFVFEFDSYDSGANTMEGAYVDDFKLSTVCDQAYQCLSSVECQEVTPSEPACSIEKCVGNSCSSEPNVLKPNCCEQQIITGASYDFDGPCSLEGWKSSTSDSVKWQADNFKNKTPGGQCGLYFGNAQSHTYDKPGAAVSGTATSPAIDVTAYPQVQVSYWAYIDVKDATWFLDNISLYVDYVAAPGQNPMGQDAVEVWAKPCSNVEDGECTVSPPPSPCDVLGCTNLTMGQWIQYSFIVDFTGPEFSDWIWDAFGSKYAVFQFKFASGDQSNNNGVGVFIDDFQVKSLCQ